MKDRSLNQLGSVLNYIGISLPGKTLLSDHISEFMPSIASKYGKDK